MRPLRRLATCRDNGAVPGGGEGQVGGRDRLAQVAASETLEELERKRVERAKAESTACTLQAERLSFASRVVRHRRGSRRGSSGRVGRRPGSKSLKKVPP